MGTSKKQSVSVCVLVSVCVMTMKTGGGHKMREEGNKKGRYTVKNSSLFPPCFLPFVHKKANIW